MRQVGQSGEVNLYSGMLISCLIISGCTTTSKWGDEANAGGAVYEYKKITTPDGAETCTARSTSAREIVGAAIEITADCAFKVEVEEATSPYEVMDKLIDMIDVAP